MSDSDRLQFAKAIVRVLPDVKLEEKLIEDQIEIPKDKSHGDLAFPCFYLAKEMKKAPQKIAEEITEKLSKKFSAKAVGPYVNITLKAEDVTKDIISDILKEKDKYGKGKKTNKVILVESPGPNTNKPLHLGHLRNILLGDSMKRILQFCGNDVHIVNVVNDRGVHICKSMFAYKMLGGGKTPKTEKMKSDHFVGGMYVEYSKLEKKDSKIDEKIQNMLLKWEDDDPEIRALWKKMNKWALDGFKETYDRLGFDIEKEYYESDTYQGGKDIILGGLKKRIFEKDEEGAVIIDFEKEGLGKKVLLRANGTSVYITQDINMANIRYDDYKFDEMIYVVGNEQQYHFKVLFEVFKKLGWDFAKHCRHFSYGMVELPEGKMKSREGIVVDTDNLLNEVTELAKNEVLARYDDLTDSEVAKRADIIGKGALRFFILKFDALKNFIFNPKESLSFEGETGPYVQYTHARIASILRKGKVKSVSNVDYKALDGDADKYVAQILSEYPDVVKKAALDLKPNLICHYLIKLCKAFNSYYVNNPILKSDDNVRNARLALVIAIKQVIQSGLELIGIDAPDRM
jgi:arginyl-tRNA synthetase